MLQSRAHKAKLPQKSALPAKSKVSIGANVHYSDFTRTSPKWVAGKVTGYVGNKKFIVQGPDGRCRRHEDQLKLRLVPKLNRQRSLNYYAAFEPERRPKTDQQRYYNDVPEFDVHQPDKAVNEKLHIPVDPHLVPRRSTRGHFGIPTITHKNTKHGLADLYTVHITDHVTRKYRDDIVVILEWHDNTNTKYVIYQRWSDSKYSIHVMFTVDTPIIVKGEQFLTNRQNNQRFKNRNCQTHNASGEDAFLIVLNDMQYVTSCMLMMPHTFSV